MCEGGIIFAFTTSLLATHPVSKLKNPKAKDLKQNPSEGSLFFFFIFKANFEVLQYQMNCSECKAGCHAES